jgi:hypothetical protein
MQLCETTRESDGSVRYYADGRRISRAVMVAIKGDHRLDTFQTVCRKGYTRLYCVATPQRRGAA